MQIRRELAIRIGIGVVSFGAGVVTGFFYKKLHREFQYANQVRNDLDTVLLDHVKLSVDNMQLKREVNKNLQENNKILEKLAKYTKEHLTEDDLDPLSASLFRRNSKEIDKSRQSHPTSRKVEWPQAEQAVDEPMVTIDRREMDPNWDYDIEVANRSSETPYILHRDEYFSNEMDFEQTTLMYYRRDNVLCDEADRPIPDYHKLVGELKFGHGSLDPSICYVRNETIEHEWEIILDEGSFAVEVLGADVENVMKRQDLRHSVPKFRRD